MVGVPGSGKSTWLEHLKNTPGVSIVSRDQIRFSIIKEGDEYFSKEKEVFKKYCAEIQEKIDSEVKNIYCDATHINEKSREKLLGNLRLEGYKVNAVVLNQNLKTCFVQNAKRDGIQRVPESAIKRMWFGFRHPSTDSRKYDFIIDVF